MVKRFERGRALLIGVGHYADEGGLSDLGETPSYDAKCVADLIKDPKYCGYLETNVRVLLESDAHRNAIVAELQALASQSSPEDSVIVYFSGHGGQRVADDSDDSGGTSTYTYLCPADFDTRRPKESGILAGELTKLLRGIASKRLLVLIDACHSADAAEAKGGDLTKWSFGGPGLDRLNEGEGRVVIAACDSKEASFILGKHANSLFTHFLLQGLKGEVADRGDGLIRVFDLFDYLSNKVPAEKSQHPVFKGHARTNFPIALRRGGRSKSDGGNVDRTAPEKAAARRLKAATSVLVMSREQALDAEGREALRSIAEVSARTPQEFLVQRLARLRSQPLAGDDAVGSQFESFVALRIRRDYRVDGKPNTREANSLLELIATAPEVPMWVLLGPPGSGKSTSLLDLELSRGIEALKGGWTGKRRTLPEICVKVSLSNYDRARHASMSGEEWIRQQLQELLTLASGGTGEPVILADLLGQSRIRLLLDGLNEIREPDPRLKRERQREILRAASHFGRQQQAAPIVAVRSAEYYGFGPGVDGQRIASEVDLLPWKDKEIRQYCEKRSPRQGNPIWRSIDGAPTADRRKLIELLGNPFNLKLQCDLHQKGSTGLSHNRTDLLGRVALLRLHEASVDGKVTADLPLDESELLALSQAVRPPVIPLHEIRPSGAFSERLAELAFRLHIETGAAGWASFHAEGAVVAFLRSGTLRDEILRLGMAANFLSVEPTGHFRFAHQIWQEYFAAWYLARRVWLSDDWTADGSFDLREPSYRDGSSIDQAIDQPIRNDWDQTVRLAMPMCKAASGVLERMLPINPAMCARATLECDPRRWEGRGISALKSSLLVRSQDEILPLALRIEAGELLGELGDDIRFGVLEGRDGKKWAMPRDSWPHAVLGGSGWVCLRSGVREVVLGDAIASVDVQEGLEIGFAPVTNFEYQHFVDAGGYEFDGGEPKPWWPAESHGWLRGKVSSDNGRRWWHAVHQEWADSGHAAVDAFRRKYFADRDAEEFDRDWAPVLSKTPEEFDRWFAEHFGPKDPQRSAFLRHDQFNGPARPVVGVTLYEAQAYCQWLSKQSDAWRFRLPFEVEWAAAAQADGSDVWPWASAVEAGLTELMNFHSTRVRRTSPIGVFPMGKSPSGLVDLCGQVQEWCLPSGRYVPAASQDARLEALTAGGCWHTQDPAMCATSVFRTLDPQDLYFGRGFRMLRFAKGVF